MALPRPLRVRLAERSYRIVFADGLGAAVAAVRGELAAAGRRAAAIVDAGLAAAQPEVVAALGDLPVLVLPAGEKTKSLRRLGECWDFLAAAAVDRGGAVLALGGGVTGDLAGFAAATWLRGVACLQFPTTLLAMVDSSVGGKTGINLAAGKNLAGAFHQPAAVHVAAGALRTLPPREFAAGMAEVLKYGLLGDPPLWRDLARRPLVAWDDARLPAVVRRCCAAKARIVEADERELAPRGGRALLNLGHTFAHAVEAVAGYGAYLHGEAVAVGLVAAAHLSAARGLAPAGLPAAVAGAVAAHGLPVRLRRPLEAARLRAAMGHDKKARAGRLRFILLSAPGHAVTAGDVPEGDIAAAWSAVGARPDGGGEVVVGGGFEPPKE